MRRSVYCTASFSVCSRRRTELPIIYPDLWLDYKLATHPFSIRNRITVSVPILWAVIAVIRVESRAEAEGHPSSHVFAFQAGANVGPFTGQTRQFERVKRKFCQSLAEGRGKNKTSSIRGGTRSWGPIELARKPYSVVDSSATSFLRNFH